MSIAKQIITESGDPLSSKMTEVLNKMASRVTAYQNRRPEISDMLKAFEALGHVSVDELCRIDIRVSGDKDCFITCWKLWREVGHRLSPASPGATEIAQFIDLDGMLFWFWFSSTVCKRVKVGQKMVPQDIYETQCGTALEAPAALPAPDEGELSVF